MSTPAALILIFATWVPAWLLMDRATHLGIVGLVLILTLGNSGAILAVLFAR